MRGEAVGSKNFQRCFEQKNRESSLTAGCEILLRCSSFKEIKKRRIRISRKYKLVSANSGPTQELVGVRTLLHNKKCS